MDQPNPVYCFSFRPDSCFSLGEQALNRHCTVTCGTDAFVSGYLLQNGRFAAGAPGAGRSDPAAGGPLAGPCWAPDDIRNPPHAHGLTQVALPGQSRRKAVANQPVVGFGPWHEHPRQVLPKPQAPQPLPEAVHGHAPSKES